MRTEKNAISEKHTDNTTTIAVIMPIVRSRSNGFFGGIAGGFVSKLNRRQGQLDRDAGV